MLSSPSAEPQAQHGTKEGVAGRNLFHVRGFCGLPSGLAPAPFATGGGFSASERAEPGSADIEVEAVSKQERKRLTSRARASG